MQSGRMESASQSAVWAASPSKLGRQLLTCVGASAFLAVCAHIAVPHSLVAVPTTMQTFGVILLAIVLGPTAAAAACALYLLEGVAGAPVFAPPLSGGGLLHLLGPTGGYLLTYPLAAAIAGKLRQLLLPSCGRTLSILLAGAIALVPIFAGGTLWLAHFLPQHVSGLWRLAVLPFLPGEAIKLLFVTIVASGLEHSRATSQK